MTLTQYGRATRTLLQCKISYRSSWSGTNAFARRIPRMNSNRRMLRQGAYSFQAPPCASWQMPSMSSSALWPHPFHAGRKCSYRG